MADGSPEPQTFDQLMAALRPRLHRYCARMVGSAIDGEDVVQEALAKAAALPAAGTIDRPESWLFRIAHNAALDALRRRRRQPAIGSDAVWPLWPTARPPPIPEWPRRQPRHLLRLPVAQRSCIVLIDVLGHSLAETAAILGVSLPAVKAALDRAARRTASRRAAEAPAPSLTPVERDRLRAYADRFNARDFDALRALLAEDVRLDLATGSASPGAGSLGLFRRYGQTADWRLSPGWRKAGGAVGQRSGGPGRRGRLCDAARLGRRPDRPDPRLPVRTLCHGMPGYLASLGDKRPCS